MGEFIFAEKEPVYSTQKSKTLLTTTFHGGHFVRVLHHTTNTLPECVVMALLFAVSYLESGFQELSAGDDVRNLCLIQSLSDGRAPQS